METSDNARSMTATPVQLAATIVALVFLLVGVAGFIPGVTTHYGDLGFAGHESGSKLFGIFQVSILHNIVHLLFGVVGLLAARTAPGARNYLIGGGLVYAVLFIYGLVVDDHVGANFVPLNNADDWLHLILAVGMVALGLALGRDRRTTVRA
jgi:hypothetical protein